MDYLTELSQNKVEKCEQTEYILTASIGIKRLSSSQMPLSVSTSVKAEVLALCRSGEFNCVLTQSHDLHDGSN